MSFWKIEIDADKLTSKEAELFLKQLSPVNCFIEITEGEFSNEGDD